MCAIVQLLKQLTRLERLQHELPLRTISSLSLSTSIENVKLCLGYRYTRRVNYSVQLSAAISSNGIPASRPSSIPLAGWRLSFNRAASRYVRRVVSGISILSTEFRRRIRYICARSRRRRETPTKVSSHFAHDGNISLRTDGRWSSRCRPRPRYVGERTVIPWRGKIARRTFLRRIDVRRRRFYDGGSEEYRVRKEGVLLYFVKSFAFMKSTIVTTYTYGQHRPWLSIDDRVPDRKLFREDRGWACMKLHEIVAKNG